MDCQEHKTLVKLSSPSHPLFSFIVVFAILLLCGSFILLDVGGPYFSRIPYYIAGFTIAYGIGLVALRYTGSMPAISAPIKTRMANNRSPLAITITAIFLYAALAALLYTAWFKGDDYQFAIYSNIEEKIKVWCSQYIYRISRSGEMMAYFIGVSPNRWQVYLIIPLAVSLLPFALHRLTTSATQSIVTPKGICFYSLIFFLSLLSTQMSSWRIFSCFAASMNYLIPSIAAIFFLSYYNDQRWPVPAEEKGNRARCTITFILGTYVCWGGESLSLIVMGALLLWFTWRLRKRLYIPRHCWTGCIGCVIGATLLFASPALTLRGKNEATQRALDINSLTPEQIQDFCSNLSWEQVNLLMGNSSVIVLDGIPLWQHIYFSPYLFERYIDCSYFTLITAAVLTILLLFSSHTERFKHLSFISIATLLSLCGAFAYLLNCIPTAMSFAPATFTLLVVVSYAYWKGHIPVWQTSVVTLCIVGIALWHLLPAGIEAWSYKKFEQQRFEEIARQKALGHQDIILPPAYPQMPNDTMGLIRRADLKEPTKGYPNYTAAKFYRVKTISQQAVK